MARLYYAGTDARITTHVFESYQPVHQSFAIVELEKVHTPRDRRWPDTMRGPVRFGSTAMAGLLSTAAIVDHELATHVLPSALLVGGALISAGVASASWSVRRRPHELRALYRGQLVCMYRTHDRLRFGQVTRALLRALDACRATYGTSPVGARQ
jgi:hypothetical protein